MGARRETANSLGFIIAGLAGSIKRKELIDEMNPGGQVLFSYELVKSMIYHMGKARALLLSDVNRIPK